MQSTQGKLELISSLSVRRSRGARSWKTIARYTYSVGGEEHSGDRVALEFNIYLTKGEVKAAIGNRKAGDSVTVWYDPEHQKFATLDKTPSKYINNSRNLAIAFIGVAAIGAGLAIFG